ncbi:endonuclease/exonuclease/phosphatase family protein [Cryobacterium psychrophilum]|uniref:Endonuclease/exonuclease/phosphatase family protein n=1 Tax=Cryobacterium psychrophilum TaxID=41988 RepID=A0A4Y8KPT3_9MICO|nr:endonuclease/exonuclease/phosphatase family protein [Cryobacterium psychrophilum]TDW30915.1 endonuclease/exonuclease/phosphatase (EEP) superfamily protein YafD [Cryobacterium psychrophilum]TFD80790.1 endonuclease/exonuclease/phosphatase family protein [Cryobacterium psychrophilum]
MFTRIVRSLVAVAAAATLLVFAWPQAFGLQNTWVIAHAVSLRGLAVVGAGFLVLLFLLLSRFRPWRRTMTVFIVLTLLFGVANVGILASRGLGEEAAAQATPASDSVTVLSWNTLGDAPGAAAIAKLALEQNASVITLPETTQEAGIAVAEAMRSGGRPMWVHTLAFDEISKARSTTLLISPDLGDYTVTNEAGSGPPGNTNVLPTVVATPVNGVGPTIVAVHAVAPIEFEMSNWRSDLDWLADQCQNDNIIMAGDFNATIDHMSGRGSEDGAVLGNCHDAALSSGSAAIGTWTTKIPALLGSPIDHVLTSSNWTVTNMHVITSLDSAGSDHRPIVATFTSQ